jgi:hypothetical protein
MRSLGFEYFCTYASTFRRNVLPPYTLEIEAEGSSKTLVPLYQTTPWYNQWDHNPNICSPENHRSQNWACYRMGRKWLDRDDESTWANTFSRFVLDFHLNSSSPWLCSGQSVIQMEIGWTKRNIALEICIHLLRRHWWLQSRIVCQRTVIPPSVGHSVARDCNQHEKWNVSSRSWLFRKRKMKFSIGKSVVIWVITP